MRSAELKTFLKRSDGFLASLFGVAGEGAEVLVELARGDEDLAEPRQVPLCVIANSPRSERAARAA